MSKVSLHFLSTLVNCLHFQVCCTLDCSTFFLEGNVEVVLFHRFHGWEVSGEHFQRVLVPVLFAVFLLRLLYWRTLFFLFLVFVTPVVAVSLLDVLDAFKHASEVCALLSLNSLCLCFGGAQ